MASIGALALLLAALSPRDARADGDEGIGFEQVWSHAREHSPLLAVARAKRARIAAAKARVRPVLAENPTVGLQAGPRFQGGHRNYDVGASVSQPVRIAGERRGERALAAETEARLEAEITEETWRVRSELRARFHAAAVARAKLRVMRQAAALQERITAAVEKQAQAGEVARLHERLAAVERARARRGAMAAELALTRAKLAVAQLAGFPLDAPPVPRDEPGTVALPELGTLVQRARARSPRVALLEAGVREGEAERALSERRRFTSPEVGVAYSRQGTTPVSDPVSHTVLGTLTIPVPLWQRNQPERAATRAEHAMLLAERAAGESLVVAEVIAAHAEARSLGEQLALYRREIVSGTRDHLEQLARAVELGELSILDFLTARERLLAAELEALELGAEYGVALGRLELLAGVELGGSGP